MTQTEYALAGALKRCLELARQGSSLKQDTALGYAGSFGRAQAKFDAIIAVADSTLAVYVVSAEDHDICRCDIKRSFVSDRIVSTSKQNSYQSQWICTQCSKHIWLKQPEESE